MKLGLDTLHEKSWFKSLAALTGFLVSFVGLATALVSLFFHTPAAPPAAHKIVPAPVVNTAAATVAVPATVSVAPAPSGPRTLDDAFKQRLAQELNNKDAGIIVVCVHQDDEAAKYARAIQSYLKGAGYGNVMLSFTGFAPSFHGVDIEKDNNRVFIKVGHQ